MADKKPKKSIFDNKYVLSGALVLYVLILFIGAIISIPADLSIVNNNDKLIHFLEFFILAILLLKTLQAYNLKNIYALSIIIGVVFMVLSEVMQSFIPNRTFSYYDFIADIAGFTCGALIFKWMYFKQ
ncbi:MAG: VanZ family protein [Candidatus Nanoarchaeia archaeon]